MFEDVKSCIFKCADFSGRASQGEFSNWVLFVAIVVGALLAEWLWLSLAAFAISLLPTAAAVSRRLHDTNRSGWWIALALIPFPGALFLAALLAFEGTPGPNRFGDDPLDREPRGPCEPMPNDAKPAFSSMQRWHHRRQTGAIDPTNFQVQL